MSRVPGAPSLVPPFTSAAACNSLTSSALRARENYRAIAWCRRLAIKWFADPEAHAIVLGWSPSGPARVRTRTLTDFKRGKHRIIEPRGPSEIANTDGGVEGHCHDDRPRDRSCPAMLPALTQSLQE